MDYEKYCKEMREKEIEKLKKDRERGRLEHLQLKKDREEKTKKEQKIITEHLQKRRRLILQREKEKKGLERLMDIKLRIS